MMYGAIRAKMKQVAALAVGPMIPTDAECALTHLGEEKNRIIFSLSLSLFQNLNLVVEQNIQ